ncbi:tripartite motif-containing protein 5-like [Rhinoraja longicauda]
MPVDEAVEFYKDQVESSFESLTEKKSDIEDMEQLQEESISGVQEVAGRKTSDEAKPMLVVDDALPIETFDLTFFYNMALRETSDIIKRGRELDRGGSLSHLHGFLHRSGVTGVWPLLLPPLYHTELGQGERNPCPECREEFEDRTLRVSRALARLAEKARTLSLNRTEKESKPHCEKHQEELKLFCETDKKLICLVCAAGREHREHRFMMVDEAAENYKGQVKSSIQSLAKDKSGIQQMEQQQKEKIAGVLEQSHNLQSKITSQFAEMHQILTEKEQRVLADIREEEKKILTKIVSLYLGAQDKMETIEPLNIEEGQDLPKKMFLPGGN